MGAPKSRPVSKHLYPSQGVFIAGPAAIGIQRCVRDSLSFILRCILIEGDLDLIWTNFETGPDRWRKLAL